jgi:hypothetical protein
MIDDVSFNPVNIRLFGAITVMAGAQQLANVVEKFRHERKYLSVNKG